MSLNLSGNLFNPNAIWNNPYDSLSSFNSLFQPKTGEINLYCFIDTFESEEKFTFPSVKDALDFTILKISSLEIGEQNIGLQLWEKLFSHFVLESEKMFEEYFMILINHLKNIEGKNKLIALIEEGIYRKLNCINEEIYDLYFKCICQEIDSIKKNNFELQYENISKLIYCFSYLNKDDEIFSYIIEIFELFIFHILKEHDFNSIKMLSSLLRELLSLHLSENQVTLLNNKLGSSFSITENSYFIEEEYEWENKSHVVELILLYSSMIEKEISLKERSHHTMIDLIQIIQHKNFIPKLETKISEALYLFLFDLVHEKGSNQKKIENLQEILNYFEYEKLLDIISKDKTQFNSLFDSILTNCLNLYNTLPSDIASKFGLLIIKQQDYLKKNISHGIQAILLLNPSEVTPEVEKVAMSILDDNLIKNKIDLISTRKLLIFYKKFGSGDLHQLYLILQKIKSDKKDINLSIKGWKLYKKNLNNSKTKDSEELWNKCSRTALIILSTLPKNKVVTYFDFESIPLFNSEDPEIAKQLLKIIHLLISANKSLHFLYEKSWEIRSKFLNQWWGQQDLDIIHFFLDAKNDSRTHGIELLALIPKDTPLPVKKLMTILDKIIKSKDYPLQDFKEILSFIASRIKKNFEMQEILFFLSKYDNFYSSFAILELYYTYCGLNFYENNNIKNLLFKLINEEIKIGNILILEKIFILNNIASFRSNTKYKVLLIKLFDRLFNDDFTIKDEHSEIYFNLLNNILKIDKLYLTLETTKYIDFSVFYLKKIISYPSNSLEPENLILQFVHSNDSTLKFKFYLKFFDLYCDWKKENQKLSHRLEENFILCFIDLFFILSTEKFNEILNAILNKISNFGSLIKFIPEKYVDDFLSNDYPAFIFSKLKAKKLIDATTIKQIIFKNKNNLLKERLHVTNLYNLINLISKDIVEVIENLDSYFFDLHELDYLSAIQLVKEDSYVLQTLLIKLKSEKYTFNSEVTNKIIKLFMMYKCFSLNLQMKDCFSNTIQIQHISQTFVALINNQTQDSKSMALDFLDRVLYLTIIKNLENVTSENLIPLYKIIFDVNKKSLLKNDDEEFFKKRNKNFQNCIIHLVIALQENCVKKGNKNFNDIYNIVDYFLKNYFILINEEKNLNMKCDHFQFIISAIHFMEYIELFNVCPENNMIYKNEIVNIALNILNTFNLDDKNNFEKIKSFLQLVNDLLREMVLVLPEISKINQSKWINNIDIKKQKYQEKLIKFKTII